MHVSVPVNDDVVKAIEAKFKDVYGVKAPKGFVRAYILYELSFVVNDEQLWESIDDSGSLQTFYTEEFGK